MAYSSKVVDKFEKTLKDPKAASVGRWKPGDEAVSYTHLTLPTTMLV